MTIETRITPVLMTQVKEFCTGDTHELYQHVLGCNYSASFLEHRHERIEAARGLCGPTCVASAEKLQRLGGCDFLEDLCENFQYTRMGPGHCLVANANGYSVTAPGFVSHGAPYLVVANAF